MTLEAVVFPQDPFTYGCKDYLTSLVEGSWSSTPPAEEKDLFGIVNTNIDNNILHANWDSSSPSTLQNVKDQWDSHSSPEISNPETTTITNTDIISRRKRRRAKSAKNEKEIENQRMTHIAVERNRRKQMNEYLTVLRSLMPPSYVQRGDQASIIGGAINFVKELEQLLQCMKSKKKTKEQAENGSTNGSTALILSSPFDEFFMFPQYSTRATPSSTCYPGTSEVGMMVQKQNHSRAVADIEVTLVDNHANMKILLKKRQGLLTKMVVGLQSLGFNILHLNVTTADDFVLASFSVKVEEGCQVNTVEEIAAAVNQLSLTVQDEATTFS